METGKQPKLRFDGVEIVSVKFDLIDNQNEIDNIDEVETAINAVLYFSDEDPSLFKVIQTLTLNKTECFVLELMAIGSFRLGENLTEVEQEMLVHRNAPAIMFPYIRSFVSTFTANLNSKLGTITVPTHFFSGKLELLSSEN